MNIASLTGGCRCGAIRFSIAAGGVEAAGYCHCAICRRLSGAPVTAWAATAAGAYSLSAGTPVIYQSSPDGSREFCATCGSQLLFRGSDGSVTVSTTALDSPADLAVVPTFHIHTASRLDWFEIADALPRHPAGNN